MAKPSSTAVPEFAAGMGFALAYLAALAAGHAVTGALWRGMVSAAVAALVIPSWARWVAGSLRLQPTPAAVEIGEESR